MPSSGAAQIDRVLGNPFELPPGEWLQATARWLEGRSGSAGGSAEAELAELVAHAFAGKRARRPGRGARGGAERLVSAALRCYEALDTLAGSSESLRRVQAAAWSASFGASLASCERLERVIREHDVIITGETGSGKEAIARAIALGTLGPSSGGPAPFAALNIAAVPETLVESELFGHVRGAFTGAGKNRMGHIRSIASGCLFLDEVGDLPGTTQSKLLRVMETDVVTPVGSETSFAADVRYVAATHKDLRAMVLAGTFRQDLYERLAGLVIRLPPLRERPEDIVPIGSKFAARYLTPEAPEWRRLRAFLRSSEAQAHPWTGNVRELQNCLRNVLLGLDPGLSPAHHIPLRASPTGLPGAIGQGNATMRQVEDWYLGVVLERAADNHALAARILGVDRTTVARRARQRQVAVKAQLRGP
jgi:two-component system response regulator HydG